jgi:hypothetical protein
MSKGIFEARKLDNQTKSAVVHDLSSVLSGVRTIRGFQRESLFQKRYLPLIHLPLSGYCYYCLVVILIKSINSSPIVYNRFNADLNRNVSANALFSYGKRWFMFRMDMLGSVTIILTCIAAIAFKGKVSAAAAGKFRFNLIIPRHSVAKTPGI